MINNDALKTVANYAQMNGVTATYVYRLAKTGKITLVEIDGVKFVDTEKHPTLKS